MWKKNSYFLAGLILLGLGIAHAAQGPGTITSSNSAPYLKLDNANDVLTVDNAYLRLTESGASSQLVGPDSRLLVLNNGRVIVDYRQTIQLIGSGSTIDISSGTGLFNNYGGGARVVLLGSRAGVKIDGTYVYQVGTNAESGQALTVFGKEVSLDNTPPALAGEAPIKALSHWRSGGATPKTATASFYYYQRNGSMNDDIIRISVTLDANDYDVKGCYQSFSRNLTPTLPPQWDDKECVLAENKGDNTYLISIDLENLTITPNGYVYPIIIMAKDKANNLLVTDGQDGRPSPFQAVLNFNPSNLANFGPGTTDWSAIDDFTSVNDLTFVAYQGDKTTNNRVARLRFEQAVNLCQSDILTATNNWTTSFYLDASSVLVDTTKDHLPSLARMANVEWFTLTDAEFEPAIIYDKLTDGTTKITKTGDGKNDYANWIWEKASGHLGFYISDWGHYYLDTKKPTVPGTPRLVGASETSLTFALGAASQDVNLFQYKLFFKKGNTSEISTSDLIGATINASDYHEGNRVTVKNLESDRAYTLQLVIFDRANNTNHTTLITENTTKSGTIGEKEIADRAEQEAAAAEALKNKKWQFGREAASPAKLSYWITTYRNFTEPWSEVNLTVEKIDYDGLLLHNIGTYKGTIPFNILIRDIQENISAKFKAGTKALIGDNTLYTKTIATPRLAKEFKETPSLKIYRGVYLGPVDKSIHVDQPYILHIPFSNLPINPDKKYKIYYFDEDRQTYRLESGGGKLVYDEERNTVLEVTPKYFGLFILAEPTGLSGSSESGSTIPAETGSGTGTTLPSCQLCDLQGHWSEPYVRDLVSKGIMAGYPDGHFAPNDKVTRDQLAKILVKAFNLPVPSQKLTHFADVPQGSWFEPYVNALFARKIITGYEDNTFRPKKTLLRLEVAKLAVTAAGVSLPSSPSSFLDVPVKAWYRPYVVFLEKNKLVKGVSAKNFGSFQEVTRAEVAKIIYLLRKYKGL